MEVNTLHSLIKSVNQEELLTKYRRYYLLRRCSEIFEWTCQEKPLVDKDAICIKMGQRIQEIREDDDLVNSIGDTITLDEVLSHSNASTTMDKVCDLCSIEVIDNKYQHWLSCKHKFHSRCGGIMFLLFKACIICDAPFKPDHNKQLSPREREYSTSVAKFLIYSSSSFTLIPNPYFIPNPSKEHYLKAARKTNDCHAMFTCAYRFIYIIQAAYEITRFIRGDACSAPLDLRKHCQTVYYLDNKLNKEELTNYYTDHPLVLKCNGDYKLCASIVIPGEFIDMNFK
jgi:hypothetical protein